MSQQYYYPQKMGRLILQGMDEVISANGVASVLRLGSLDGFIGNYHIFIILIETQLAKKRVLKIIERFIS